MLQQQIFQELIPAAEQLENKGIGLVPKPNSPLSELLALSIPPLAQGIKSKEDLEILGVTVEYVTCSISDLPSQHDLLMGGVSDDISKLVAAHLNSAKNEVRPLVLELAEELAHYLETFKPAEASSIMKIVTLDIPEILLDESFLDTIRPYEGRSIIRPNSSINIGLKTKEEITALIVTGSSRLDKQIIDWLSQQGDEFIFTVWNSFFCTVATEGVISYDQLEAMNVYEKCNIALAVFLLARKLFDDVQEVANMDLQRYRTIIASIRDYAASIIAASSNLLANFSTSKMLVIMIDRYNKIVKVNGAVYREWLQQGGSTDIILGLLASDRDLYSLSMINENRDKLLETWSFYQNSYRSMEQSKALTYYKNYLEAAFTQSLANKTPLEEAYSAKNSNYLLKVKQLFDAELANIKTVDASKSYDVALCLVAKCRFFYTSAYEILECINSVGKDNPQASARDAALVATICYLADTLTCQISAISDTGPL